VKIDNPIKPIGTTEITTDARLGKGKSAAKPENAPGVDVTLSPEATRLQGLDSALDGAGDVVDAARVAEIKQAIAEGRFRINPEAIADRLLETVRELLRSTRSL